MKSISICFVIVLFYSFLNVHADEFKPDILPGINSGTEFMVCFIPGSRSDSSQFRLYVGSTFATKVRLEIKDANYVIEKVTVPNDIIEFSLDRKLIYLYSSDYSLWQHRPLPAQVWAGKAIHITSDDPIVCYGIFNAKSTPGGFRALPVNALGKLYQVASYASNISHDEDSQSFPSFTSIVGVYDSTTVEFTMGGCDSCRALFSFGNLYNSQSASQIINKGDVWLIPGDGPHNDLTGSLIKSDKPVSVISGSYAPYIPVGTSSGDYSIEQELPVESWGNHFLVPIVHFRKKPPIIKIFASVPDTKVSIDNFPAFYFSKAGIINGEGFIETRLNTDGVPKPALITSDKPVNVMFYNTGQADDATETDPFEMSVIPTNLFSKDFLFCTPAAKKGLDQKNNYINVVTKTDKNGNISPELQISESKDGKISLIPFKQLTFEAKYKFDATDSDTGHYEQITYKLPPEGVFLEVNPVDGGIFKMAGNEPFAVYVHGHSAYNGYGYPGSGGLQEVIFDDTNPPLVKSKTLQDSSIEGSTNDADNEVQIISGVKDDEFIPTPKVSGLSYLFLTENSYNYSLKYDKFTPGKDNFTKFRVEVTDTLIKGHAELKISDRAGNYTISSVSHNVTLSVPVLIAAGKDFGMFKHDQDSILKFKLTNTGNSKTYTLKNLFVENDTLGFSINKNIPENTILEPGQEIEFEVLFKAKPLIQIYNSTEGNFTTKIGYSLNTKEKRFLADIKANVVNPKIEVFDVVFKNQTPDEEPQTKYVFVTNSSKSSLEILGFEYDKNAPFEFILPKISGQKKFIISAFDTVKIPVTFKPSKLGSYETVFKIISDGFIIDNEAVIKGNCTEISSVEEKMISDNIRIINENGSLKFISDENYFLDKIEIYDLSGKLVVADKLNQPVNGYSITTTEFITGIYLIKMKVNGIIISKKVII